MSAAETFQRWEARMIAAANWVGTKPGSAPRSPRPSPAPYPTDAEPAFKTNPKCQGSQLLRPFRSGATLVPAFTVELAGRSAPA